MRVFPDRGDALAGVSLAGVAITVLVGVFLRVRGLASQLVFSDEIHGLAEAAAHGYGHIFTHVRTYDASIPLTLYNKFIMESVGLDELLFRFPSVLFGCATLVLLARMLWTRFGPVTTWLAVGLLAVSPYHVYLTREARPYAIVIFLLTAAIHGALTWSVSGSRAALLFAALASFGALYFHIISLPAVAVLFFYVWWRAIAGGIRKDRRSAWVSTGLLAGLCLAFLGPALPSLCASVFAKVAKGKPGLDTLQYGLYLPLALHRHAWLPELALAGAGFRTLVRDRRPEAFLLGGLLCVQTAFVLLMRPQSVDLAWVWSRYFAILLPVWFLFVATGVVELVRRLAGKRLQVAVAAALVLAIGFYNGKDGLYPLGRNRDFNVHPMIMSHELGRKSVLRSLPSSDFYRQLRDRGDDGAVLEVPFVMIFPIYDIYQRIHRRPVFTGALGSGSWQELFNGEKRFRFRRMVDVRDPEALAALPVRYVVVHKDIGSEIESVYRSFLPFETTRHLLKVKGFNWRFTPQIAEVVFGHRSTLLEWGASQFGSPVYEDDTVAVYTLTGSKKGSSGFRVGD